MIRQCPCGAEFPVANWQIKSGRGRYCSKSCMYRYRIRPSGLSYEIVAKNRGWIEAGQQLSPETQFRPGGAPWNFSPGSRWDSPEYRALHHWVKREKGTAADLPCQHCHRSAAHWANLSHEYRWDLNDFIALCAKCHARHDKNHMGASCRVEARP